MGNPGSEASKIYPVKYMTIVVSYFLMHFNLLSILSFFYSRPNFSSYPYCFISNADLGHFTSNIKQHNRKWGVPNQLVTTLVIQWFSTIEVLSSKTVIFYNIIKPGYERYLVVNNSNWKTIPLDFPEESQNFSTNNAIISR